jgi:hypothetical protein
MDSLYSTPLFDLFRRGEVAYDLRMLAAEGALAPRAHEQLALLVFLTSDNELQIRSVAMATLARIPERALVGFLGRSEVSDEVRAFFAARGIVPESSVDVPSDESLDDPLLAGDGEALPSDTEEEALEIPAADEAGDGSDATERKRVDTVQRLALLNVTEKVKAAMRGTREERGILIRDPNKLVSVAVLSSPKLTAQEVENFARMGSVSEESLRVIGTTRAWVKNYGIVRALCMNPKTPVSLSLGYVKRLLERDIKAVVTDRNLPDPLKIAAKKVMQAGQSRRG